MGTSLTGLTPATTYDALIKVGDNGPLSATAKVLSDGLGNDSPLSMSTSNVGIGISSPVYRLQINASGGNGISLIGDVNNEASILFGDSGSAVIGRLTYDNATDSMRIFTNGTESMRITSAGNVGIGTSSPTQKLEVAGKIRVTDDLQLWSANPTIVWESGRLRFYNNTTATEVLNITSDNYLRMLSGTGGIQFNGDTAAANALDDYEEGTWTPTFNAAVTTSGTPTGKYTKVGRTVYATCAFSYTALTGADINISGLPFTNGAIRQATAVAFAGVARTTNQFFGTLVEASANNFYIEVVNSASGVSLTAHASCWYQV